MAEEEAVEAQESTAKRESLLESKGVRLALGILAIVVLVAIVVGIAYVVAKKVGLDQRSTGSVIRQEKEEIQPPPEVSDLGTFTTVLFDEGGRPYSMKIHVKIAVNSDRPDKPEVTREISERSDQLTDAVYEVLSATNPKNFIGGPNKLQQGYKELRASLKKAINSRMKHKVDDVLLVERVIQ
ncbi:MAG: hypothetical protein D6679_04435 [Candidatus Hydrogenedentota bacterium]|nr:MAG: hypothetical protein D6679_04435 [Candidatus Hydrogenedentota bacterium]